MHAAIKILVGVVLLISSIAYVYTNQYGAWDNFLVVLSGTVPAFVSLVGVFIIWIELDDIKVKREMKKSKARSR